MRKINRKKNICILIAKGTACILLTIFIIWSGGGCSRINNGMVHIDEKYTYDKESHIIYEEVWDILSKSYHYKPYYDIDGKLYRYDETTGEWIKLE